MLGYNKEQLAKMLRISRSTLWGKLADPASFRLGELLMLYHILKFTDEEKQILL